MSKTDFQPMHRLGARRLDDYLADDSMARWISTHRHERDSSLVCQRWLDETPAKRYAASILYGDLLDREGLRVLDVGGGLTSVTRELAGRHSLTLVDLMAHDAAPEVNGFLTSAPPFDVIQQDWYTGIPSGYYDVVVAADIFPNVDQRLGLFIQRVMPTVGELRLSLTYYNEPRYYLTRRINADEVLCMLVWDGDQTARTLARFADRIDRPDFDVFSHCGDSVYANKRQVCLLRMFGEAKA